MPFCMCVSLYDGNKVAVTSCVNGIEIFVRKTSHFSKNNNYK